MRVLVVLLFTGFDDDDDTAAEALVVVVVRGVRVVRDDDAERPVDTTTGGMDVAVVAVVAPLRFRDGGAAFTVVSMVSDSMDSIVAHKMYIDSM